RDSSKPEQAKRLLAEAQEDVNIRWQMYQYLAARQLEIHNGKNERINNGSTAKVDRLTSNK
ncbi:MAG: hypothetical protein AB4038_21850, partial [Prochloraceae cyanobacterium]